MKLQITLLLFVLTSATGTSAQPNRLVCETSGGSPETFHAFVMAEEMSGNDGFACQDRGTDCTTIWTHDTAAAHLCGTVGGCVPFKEAADAIRTIAGQCADGNRVGGKFHIRDDLRIDLFHA